MYGSVYGSTSLLTLYKERNPRRKDETVEEWEARLIEEMTPPGDPLPTSEDARSVRLLVVGDNRDGDQVLETITRRAAGDPPDAMLHLGDMVPSGRSDAEWMRFLAAAHPLLASRPMIAVLGNHEIATRGGRTRFGTFARRFGSRTPSVASYRVGPAQIVLLDSNDPKSLGTTQLEALRAAVTDARARGAAVAADSAICRC